MRALTAPPDDAAAVYLALALRRVQGRSWLMTGINTLSLFLLYQALPGLWMVSAIAAAFRVLPYIGLAQSRRRPQGHDLQLCATC